MSRTPPKNRTTTLGLLQHACTPDPRANLDTCLRAAESAAKDGARIICTQELFRSQYFCQSEDHALFALAAAAWMVRNLHYYVTPPASPVAQDWFWWATHASMGWVLLTALLLLVPPPAKKVCAEAREKFMSCIYSNGKLGEEIKILQDFEVRFTELILSERDKVVMFLKFKMRRMKNETKRKRAREIRLRRHCFNSC